MEQKQRFVSLVGTDRFTMAELCESFGISRKTGHKWKGRYEAQGMAGLEERSRAPKTVRGRTEAGVERLIVGEKRLHPTWGPKKIQRVLEVKHALERAPAVSTVGEVLKRHGLVQARKKRGGLFTVERGTRTQAMPDMTVRWTQREFRSVFRRYGLPEIIRVDNGAPFASMGPAGLSRLSVWWIGLGIEVQFSRPGCPQDNGCHERMHRTMKTECCRPGSANRGAQQQRFERWRRVFNQERPHEGIGMRTPGEVYQPSARRLDERIKPDLYDAGVETRRVNQAGFISWQGNNCYVGESLIGAEVAVEQSPESGLLAVRYANVKLGWLESTPNARLRPPAYAARWESKACTAPQDQLTNESVTHVVG